MLISCIMPTANRRAFVPMAIASYLSQDWKEKELIVVDDGPEPVWDLVQHVPGIVYLRFPSRMNVGRKRNIACEHAAGDLIVHWDDDDWSAPNRITEQVNRLRQSGKAVTGYHSILFWDLRTGEGSKYKGELNYACGSSLCYRKDFWATHRFGDFVKGEDTNFVGRAHMCGQLSSVDGGQMLVATSHTDNTNPREIRQFPAVVRSQFPEGFFTALECASLS